MTEISLIINTYNRADMIEGVLNSACKQNLDKERFEVLIVDQSTNDETEKTLENYPKFRYIKTETKGLSISRNIAIENSTGEILVFVDDDVYFDKDYLQNILNFFKNSELKPDMIGGRTYVDYLAQKPDWIDGPLLGILAFSDYGNEPLVYDNHPKHVPYGCNMAVKRECLELTGGFSSIISSIDKKMTENEDVILANKLRNSGKNLVYTPNMLVFHKMPESRLNYEYYRKRYFSQGQSDAYIYFILGMYKLSDIPEKLVIHTKRLIESIIFRFIKKDCKNWEKYYQKLRLYYNAGYIKALLRIIKNKGKFNENS